MAIILVDKPTGITSFDCIRFLRKKIGIFKMGHAGTLDPLASGLLIIATDKDTKRLSEFLKLPKVYAVTILFGVRTDSGDITGKILDEQKIAELPTEVVRTVVSGLLGTNKLPVPMYSAIKVGGKPLYAYARAGRTDILPPEKEMTVTDVRIVSYKHPFLELEMQVSSGTYIRSLAEELGRRLNLPATVKELHRLSIGPYSVSDAIPIRE